MSDYAKYLDVKGDVAELAEGTRLESGQRGNSLASSNLAVSVINKNACLIEMGVFVYLWKTDLKLSDTENEDG
jgi:hypothetical protein